MFVQKLALVHCLFATSFVLAQHCYPHCGNRKYEDISATGAFKIRGECPPIETLKKSVGSCKFTIDKNYYFTNGAEPKLNGKPIGYKFDPAYPEEANDTCVGLSGFFLIWLSKTQHKKYHRVHNLRCFHSSNFRIRC